MIDSISSEQLVPKDIFPFLVLEEPVVWIICVFNLRAKLEAQIFQKAGMPRSREISEDVRKQVVEAHQTGKGYKLISRALGLPKATIRAILCKWKRFGTVGNLPRSGRPPKISPKTRRKLISEVMKNPCMTSKALQATLASTNVHVHDSTIRRMLGIHRRPTLSGLHNSMMIETSPQEDEETQEVSEKLINSADKFSRDVKIEVLSECDSISDPVDGGVETMEEEQPVGQDSDDCHGIDADGGADGNNGKRIQSGAL